MLCLSGFELYSRWVPLEYFLWSRFLRYFYLGELTFADRWKNRNSIQFIFYSHCFHRLHVVHYLDKEENKQVVHSNQRSSGFRAGCRNDRIV